MLSELHHSLHRLRVCQSHEPEELGPPTAFMEIHLYGFLLLFEHLKAATKRRLNTSSPGKNHHANKMECVSTNTNLSLVRARASVQVEEAVTVGAEVATHVAQDYGCGLTIIMVVTHGLWREEKEIHLFFLIYPFKYQVVFLNTLLLFCIIFTICFCCPSLPIQRPEDSLSTWSWSSTHSEAKASHS